jgi:formiminotetrahydrofolate cyclodeaminase
MEASLWSYSLAEFREKAGGTDPVPAGVSICAVNASLALSLLTKVLEITRKRKNFLGDPEQAQRLIDGARRESALLARLADDDVAAFTRYMDCVRAKQPAGQAMHDAIEVPMEAARSCARGLLLCREGAAVSSRGLTAADLGIATSLLAGAGKAMLLSVESNLVQLDSGDPYHQQITAELPVLRNHLDR